MWKLLIVAAVIAGVWYLMRVGQRKEKAAKLRLQEPVRQVVSRWAATTATDAVKCPQCGDYVPAGNAVECGRRECPATRVAARGG